MDATVAAAGIDSAALEELRSSFAGELVQPGDPSYDERRAVWNLSLIHI